MSILPSSLTAAGLHREAADLPAEKPVATIALWGDSITDNTSSYSYFAVQGINYAMQYELRPEVANPNLYSVSHVNPGGNGPLTVLMEGAHLTVTLARTSGVVTSSINDVRAAVLAAYGSIFLINDYGGDPDTDRAQVQGTTYFHPYSRYSNYGTYVWLQTLMKQRFSLARRIHDSFQGPDYNPVGDWDFGYSGQTAYALSENPGPSGDILTADADLIIGCAGTNDIYRGSDAATVRDRIVGLWDFLDGAGKRFMWMEIPPSGVADREARIEAANVDLRVLAAARNIILLPWKASFIADGVASPHYFPDGIHPCDLACFEEAQFLFSVFDPLIQPAPPDYSAGAADWITPNPGMIGGIAGRAASWVNGSLGILKTTKIAATDGGNDWQQITSKQQGNYYDTSFHTGAASGWTEGDLVEGVAEISCDESGWDVKSLSITVYFKSTDGELAGLKTYKGIYDFTPGKAFDGVVRTPPGCIPHGATDVSLVINCNGSGTFRVRNAGVRKSIYPIVPVQDGGNSDSGPVLTAMPMNAKAAGNFSGSFLSTGAAGAPASVARGGFDSFHLGADGTFTAKGSLDGLPVSIKGKLAADGGYTGTTKFGTLHLQLYSGDDLTTRISGSLTSNGSTASISLLRAGGVSLPPGRCGAYTLLIPARGTSPDEPAGDGVASLIVKSDGTLRCQYVLADGTLGTRSSQLSPGGAWQFYFPVYGNARNGYLSGQTVFRDIPEISDLDGTVFWKRSANARSASFPAGFAVERSIVGSKYTAPAKDTLSFPGLAPGTDNAEIHTGSEGVPAGMIPFTWGANDRLTASRLALTANRQTGMITGAYMTADHSKLSVYATILQKQRLVSGLFKGIQTTGAVTINPIGSN